MGHLLGIRGAPKIRIGWAAAFYAVFLSWLFITVYGGCNRITASRGDVGIWAYDWERLIPFIPVMVIPYLSIDLLFGAAPFLCVTARERRLLAARIAFGILAAGAVYCIFPLRLTCERVRADGVIGMMWNSFISVDKPYNLFPSLHMTLRTILADKYDTHTRGGWRIAFLTWFSLIGFSTVLTHQHQVVDIVAGFAMATICFYIFQPMGWITAFTPNPRLGLFYAAGGLAAGVLAPVFWNAGFFLLWTGVSMALIAGGYWVWGPAVFRKSNGRLAISARVLLAPVLLGQRLSLWHYSRQCRPWDRITESLWIGRVLTRKEAGRAVAEGVTAVLDLTGEFSECRTLRGLRYLNIQVMDLTAPTPSQLDEAVAFIRRESAAGKVFVHCKIGYSRSAAVVAAYLLATHGVDTVESAVRKIRAARPSVVIRPEAMEAIRQFSRRMTAQERDRPWMPAE